MDIQPNIPSLAAVTGAQQNNNQNANPAPAREVTPPPAGIVVDLQSREQPLNAAVQRGVQALGENLNVTITNTPQIPPAGPDEAADRLTTVVANAAAQAQASQADSSQLQDLFSTASETINQVFEEATERAPDADNRPLQLAQNQAQQGLQTLESLVGLRDA
ncbi:MAG: hypothetical protein R8K22_06565 [Mariprofundaceae bacterium]